MIKKGQTWSIDAIFAGVVFLIVFVFATVLLTDMFEEGRSKELHEESQRILQKLSSGIGPQLIKGSEVNMQNVEQMLNMTYDELKEELGVKYDFCIYFEDPEGNLIIINESFVGFGDPNVSINDMPCGPGGCYNETDFDGDNFSGTVGCGPWDCDDHNDSIYPQDNESDSGYKGKECFDGKDNDCDGLIDQEDPDCCLDQDGDGYSPIPGCTPLIDCVDNMTVAKDLYDHGHAPYDGWDNCPELPEDCNASYLMCPVCIHPLAPDPCGDDIDSNCMPATEECIGWDFNCTVKASCDTEEVELMELSSASDAHTALYDQDVYPMHLCCKGSDPENGMLQGNDYYLLSVSNETNAHVELYNRTINDIKGNGTDGEMDSISSGTTIDTDVKDEYNFTYVNLTLTESNKVDIIGSKPLIIRAEQYIHLNGAVLNVSGGKGEDSACNGVTDGKGGIGVAGGGNGGDGGNQTSDLCNSSISGGAFGFKGTGIGAGEGGNFYDADGDCDTTESDTDTEGGAGGSYASLGTNGTCSCSTESPAGNTYLDARTAGLYGRMPLVGGSGGGGGASDYKSANLQNGAGGGAGGGAVMLIAPKIIIDNGGGIYADGGKGGNSKTCMGSVSADGGGGSGGTIYLIANEIINDGNISVLGGSHGSGLDPLGVDGGDGGDGRVRIDLLGSTDGDGTACNTSCVGTCGGFSGSELQVGDGTGYCGKRFYPYGISFGIEEPDAVQGIKCQYMEGGCNELLGQECIIKVSGETDAHASNCSDTTFDDAICCEMMTTCVC